MEFPASPFWDFSLRLYGTEGVPAACLRLQERHGVDVNAMFFCLWAGATDAPVSDQAIAGRIAAVGDWHSAVVRHIRALRQRLKSGLPPADDRLVQALRAQIQKIEIDAEHVEQLTLAAGVEPGPGDQGAPAPDGAKRAHARVIAYLDSFGVSLDDADRADIGFLVDRALDAASRTRATDA